MCTWPLSTLLQASTLHEHTSLIPHTLAAHITSYTRSTLHVHTSLIPQTLAAHITSYTRSTLHVHTSLIPHTLAAHITSYTRSTLHVHTSLIPEEVRHASRNADSASPFLHWRDGKKGHTESAFRDACLWPHATSRAYRLLRSRGWRIMLA